MSEQPVALVTGAAQGIGYACAEAIAENGARPVLADINAEAVTAAAEKLGGNAVGLACDMGDPAQIAARTAGLRAEFTGMHYIRA